MDDVQAAKMLIKMLDLTSLNSNDSASKIEKLCKKAVTPYGNVAAVCIFQKFIPAAKALLRETDVKIATVVNFPSGDATLKNTREEIKKAINLGADEIDAVFPYNKFMEYDEAYCQEYVDMVAGECGKKITSKMILETGELKRQPLITRAAKMCIDGGINFIKTSTGKTEVSATPETANLIFELIAKEKKNVGFKASGGIKTTYDAKQYLVLASAVLGHKWLSAKNLRIGASSLLDDLIKTIERGY